MPEIPTIENILWLVRHWFGSEVAEALREVTDDGLMWVTESFPSMDPGKRTVIEKWIEKSDLRFKWPDFKPPEPAADLENKR